MPKKISHVAEAAALWLLFTFLRLLPLDAASAVGGWLARLVGPLLPAHRTAQKNLAMAFPGLPEKEKAHILNDMWDHLGRVVAELPHLPGNVLATRIHILGGKYVPRLGETAFYFSGHIGNWELLPTVSAIQGTPITAVYREANNPLVDTMITRLRASRSRNMVPKGARGAVKMVRAIKNREAIALLVDQKMNDGIAVPFFGRDAMTAPAIAELALRYDIPIVPARCMRTKGAHFEATIYPALTIEKTGDHARDVLALMTEINAMLERWIRETPAQWFWVHQRWPKA